MELIDIGMNLAHDSFDADRDQVLERARQAGVVQMVITGSSEESTAKARDLARSHPGALFSTDLSSTITFPSTSRSARKPSSKTRSS